MATRRPARPGSLDWQNQWANAWIKANPGKDPSFLATQPSWPNPGTYDPSFDINRDNSQLGYQRYQNDFSRDWGELGAGATGGRMGNDLQTALTRQNTQNQWTRDDITQQSLRTEQDMFRNFGRGQQDYQTSIADLLANYQRLGNNQAQSMRAAGVAQGGAAVQAAEKRAANQAHDRAPIDQNWQRYQEDWNSQRSRFQEDQAKRLGMLDTTAGWGTGDLQQQYGRGREDALTDYGRNTYDNTNYQNGLGRLAYASSGQVQPRGITLYDLLRRQGRL
jgi:hypothetical protein